MEDLSSGFPLFQQQYRSLLKKNLLLSWRNRRATFLQLFSSFFFIFLLFCIEKGTRARFHSSMAFKSVTDPKPLVSPPIPPCEDKFYVKLPCFDFVWSGNESVRLQRIVDAIRENNPGRPIPSNKVYSRDTPRDSIWSEMEFFALLVSGLTNGLLSKLILVESFHERSHIYSIFCDEG